jgi:RNA polymerase sigma-70 factor, ECF subfamily
VRLGCGINTIPSSEENAKAKWSDVQNQPAAISSPCERRHKALSARQRRPDPKLDTEIASTIADPADDPEVALQQKNRGELLRKSLARLSPEHSEVIDLVYYHGKSVKEVADIVGVAGATVKTRMFYARKKLAEWVSAS